MEAPLVWSCTMCGTLGFVYHRGTPCGICGGAMACRAAIPDDPPMYHVPPLRPEDDPYAQPAWHIGRVRIPERFRLVAPSLRVLPSKRMGHTAAMLWVIALSVVAMSILAAILVFAD